MNQILRVELQRLFREMLIRKNSQIDSMQGQEGAKIKQYFDPENTVNGISYSLAQFMLEPSKKSRPHMMRRSSEIYYILEGKGNLTINDETRPVEKDDAVYVQPNSKQFIENTGSEDLRFLCIVQPAWRQDDEVYCEN